MAKHVDLVLNQWHEGVVRLLVQIVEPSGVDATEWMQRLADEHSGTYFDSTPIHDDDECPFRDGPVARMVTTKASPDHGGKR